MATKTTAFNVKKMKMSRDGKSRFYNEVGRLFLRETPKGVSGTLYLHAFDGEYAVFPAERTEAPQPGEPQGDDVPTDGAAGGDIPF